MVSADPAPWGPARLPAQGGGRWPGFCCCLTQARCGGWGRGAGFLGGSQFLDCLHPSAGPLHQPLRRPTGRHRGADSVQAWLRPCWPGHLGHMASRPRLPHRSPTSHPLWGWEARRREWGQLLPASGFPWRRGLGSAPVLLGGQSGPHTSRGGRGSARTRACSGPRGQTGRGPHRPPAVRVPELAWDPCGCSERLTQLGALGPGVREAANGGSLAESPRSYSDCFSPEGMAGRFSGNASNSSTFSDLLA